MKALVGNTAEVAEAVAEGRVEIGLVEGAVHDPLLEQTLVGRDRLVIVAPSGHPWTKKPPRPADLAQRTLGAARERLGHAVGFRSGDRGKGRRFAKLQVSLELPSNEAVRLAVREGAGVSALSELVAEAGIKFGALAPVKFALPERAFHALRHRERYLSKSGLAFMALAKADRFRGICAVRGSGACCFSGKARRRAWFTTFSCSLS